MAVKINDLLNMLGSEGLEIVAGENGIDKEVRWTSVITSRELLSFSNEGDLNFVPEVEKIEPEAMYKMVREAKDRKLAGMVFSIRDGDTSEIPNEILEYAHVEKFPILTIPWESKITDWTKKIGMMVLATGSIKESGEETLKRILMGLIRIPLDANTKENLAVNEISFYGNYRVALVQIRKNQGCEQEAFDKLHAVLGRELFSYCRNKGYLVPLTIGYAVVLEGILAENFTEKECLELGVITAKLQALYDEVDIRIGIGQCYETIEKTYYSYNEAVLVTNLISSSIQSRKRIYKYDQMGAYRIIWECKNQDTTLDFAKEQLEALKTYDKVNNTELMEFLQNYYKYNANIKEIGAHMFLHKNTVLYKIRKIEAILDCNLSSKDDSFNIQLALMINEIYNIHR